MRPWPGKMFDIRYCNRLLSSAEISRIYLAERKRYLSFWERIRCWLNGDDYADPLRKEG